MLRILVLRTRRIWFPFHWPQSLVSRRLRPPFLIFSDPGLTNTVEALVFQKKGPKFLLDDIGNCLEYCDFGDGRCWSTWRLSCQAARLSLSRQVNALWMAACNYAWNLPKPALLTTEANIYFRGVHQVGHLGLEDFRPQAAQASLMLVDWKHTGKAACHYLASRCVESAKNQLPARTKQVQSKAAAITQAYV